MSVHPCGMVMDYIRTAYQTTMQTWQGSPIPPVRVRWFRADPGAALFEGPTVFRSRSWERDTLPYLQEPLPEVGEQSYRERWDNGRNDGAYLGFAPCGSSAWERGGVLGVDPAIQTEADGYSPCCGVRVSLPMAGALAFAGSALILRPTEGGRVYLRNRFFFGDVSVPAGEYAPLRSGPRDWDVVLPAAGAWEIVADLGGENQIGDELLEQVYARLYNVTAGAAVVGSERLLSGDLLTGSGVGGATGAINIIEFFSAGDRIRVEVLGITGASNFNMRWGQSATQFGMDLLAILLEPAPVTPAAPSNLAATLDTGAVLLTWDVPEDGDSYSVERADLPGGPFAVVMGTDYPAIRDLTVATGHTYYYRVRAVTGGTFGPYSTVVSIDVPAATFSLLLDGTGYLDLGSSSTLQPAVVAYAAWIKPASAVNAYLFGSTSADGPALYLRSDGRLTVGTPNHTVFPTTATAPVGVWTHVAATYDFVGGDWTLYVNGVLDSSGNAPIPSEAAHPNTYIGTYGPGNSIFPGKLTDAVICAALTGSQVAGLHAQTLDPRTLDYSAGGGCWLMTEGSGSTVADSSGNAHPASFVAGVAWDSDVP